MAACGDDGGNSHPPDAPHGDSGPLGDAEIDAPTPGSVNILATARSDSGLAPGTPVANVLVAALKKDGTLVGTAMTAADGTAKIDGITDGASVTAVYPIADSDHDIVTYVDVKVGDTLKFGDKYYTTSLAAGVDGTMTVTWPAVDGATMYRVWSSCDPDYGQYPPFPYTGTSLDVSFNASCQAATGPLVVKAFNGEGDEIAAIHIAAATFADDTTLDLTADQWVTPTAGNVTVGATGLSTPTNEAYLGVFEAFHGLSNTRSNYSEVDSGASTTMFTSPAADTLTAFGEFYRDGNYGEQYSYKAGATPFALSGPTLPWLGGVVVNGTQALWIQSTGTTYDAAVLSLHWNRYIPSGGKGSDGSTEYFNWNLILPPGTTSFSLPTPPAQLATYLPDDSVNVYSNLELVDLSSAADYDAARALPEYRLTNVEASVRAGDEPSVTSSVSDGGEGVGFARKINKVQRQLARLGFQPHLITPRARR
jgi:hypothetical protein